MFSFRDMNLEKESPFSFYQPNKAVDPEDQTGKSRQLDMNLEKESPFSFYQPNKAVDPEDQTGKSRQLYSL
ncbi:hypothetical protein TSAR_013441 [Trichomalopsis sarcophagae]|uniref:Uncharacterized protein n=1 Tax=Trichomalopsis sarcophagae TaxID=543379 RepID=A0A232EMK1_9HYME|nr:hypothetical protein TSAR_013441 [Trichomalopsis sarcophagae]